MPLLYQEVGSVFSFSFELGWVFLTTSTNSIWLVIKSNRVSAWLFLLGHVGSPELHRSPATLKLLFWQTLWRGHQAIVMPKELLALPGSSCSSFSSSSTRYVYGQAFR